MNERDKLIEQLIKEEGGTREQYLSLLNKIAYHESAHTMDPSIKQQGGGPGRGKFQFEIGKDQGGITAARRTKRYLDSVGMEVPKWLQEAASKDDLDASKLSNAQQEVLFLGNMKMHPKADLEKVMKGEESIEDFWANYHWAGSAKDRQKRIQSFRTSVEDYEKNRTAFASNKTTPEEVKADNFDPQERDFAASLPTHKTDNTAVTHKYKVTPQIANQQPMGPHKVAQQDFKPLIDISAGDDIFNYLKQSQSVRDKDLVEYDGGGTHEQNPIGGIPQGTGANGKPNTVEEGETAFEFGDDKFIFSDRISLTDYIKNPKKKVGDINQFSDGGSMNNCGGPGQPPCDDKKINSKVQMLDEVTVTAKVPNILPKNDPRYQAYQDSLNFYNKGLNDLKTGKHYEGIKDYVGKPRSKYPFPLLSSDNILEEIKLEKGEYDLSDSRYKNHKQGNLTKEEYEAEKAYYGKRDYEYYKSGKAKKRHQAYVAGEYYEDEDGLHRYEAPYDSSKYKGLVPSTQKIKPTSVLTGPEAGTIALYDKPKNKYVVEGSEKAKIMKRQAILKKRGTYDGPIDGVWGKGSQQALENTDFKSKEGRNKFQDINFGQYKDYFEVQGMHESDPNTTTIRMTKKNPHNASTVKPILEKIRALNPGKNFNLNNSFAGGGFLDPTDPPSDRKVIKEMKGAKKYIQKYHNSPKFKERFINAQIDYTKYGDQGIKELKQQNELNNYVQGRTALDFIDEYKYQPALENINKNLDEGQHYLLQGKNGQPIVDAIKRTMKGRPNPKANGNGSHYDAGRNIVFQYKEQLQDVGGDHGAIAAHEFSHNAVSRWGSEAETIPKEQQKYIQSLQRNVQGEHDLDPYETKGDIDALRYLLNEEKLYDAGKEDFTKDHLNKALKNGRIKDEFTFNRLLRLYGKDNIIKLMNTVASNKKLKKINSRLT
jgi:hypothetical protein